MAEDTDLTPYITVTSGISGYFAVELVWNPEYGGFWEPNQTGVGRYKTRKQAVLEARSWAASDEIRLDSELVKATK